MPDRSPDTEQLTTRAEYSITALALQGVFVFWAAYWVQSPPSVGTAIALLGIAGVIMAVRADHFSRTEKVVWVILASMLFYAETRAIKAESEKHDREQAELRIEENESFADVLRQERRSFDTTMARMERLSQLSKENVDSVTGGNDFIAVDILSPPVDRDGVSLIAVTSGTHVIREARYQLTEGRPPYLPTQAEFNDLLAGRLPPGVIAGPLGDVVPAISTPVRVMHPSLEQVAYYNINIYALNGTTNEKLEVRYNAGAWERKFTITRNNKVLRRSDWAR